MINSVNDDQDRFLLRRFQSGGSQFVRVFRNLFEMFFEIERRVSVNKIDSVGVGFRIRSDIHPFDVFYNRAAAKSLQKLLLERPLKPGINITSLFR